MPPPYLRLPSIQITTALKQLIPHPDIQQALSTSSTPLQNLLLTRILPTVPPPHKALLHNLLATHHYHLAKPIPESRHRTAIPLILTSLLPPSTHPDYHPHLTHIASAHLAHSLSILRLPGSAARTLATSHIANAEPIARCPLLHQTTSLLLALSHPPSSPSQLSLLSHLVSNNPPSPPAPDIPGFARLFLAKNASPSEAIDNAQALIVRWEAAGPSFELVEALCVAANRLIADPRESNLQLAEDFLQRAVRVAADVGTELDKGEPLLALAELYLRTGRVVEAEGLYRSIEERFEPVRSRRMFSVASAEFYARAMDKYALFLESVSFNGIKRGREGEMKRVKGEEVRDLFPEVLRGDAAVPVWVVDSLLPWFELPVPRLDPSEE